MHLDPRKRIALGAALAVGLVIPSLVFAQLKPSDGATDDTVVLSPFEVHASQDVGFVATSSLAGGRLAGDLRDTPAAYSVQTREFIDALNLVDLSEALEWTVNATSIAEDGRDAIFGNGVGVTMRGVSAQDRQRNFFPLNVDPDSYNLDRYDYARGPNAILFGNGSFGGTPNSVTKRALMGKNFGQLSASYGSWDNRRTTFDYNLVVKKNIALRVNTLWQDSQGWRDFQFNRKKAATLAGTWEISRDTSLLVEAERGNFQNNSPLSAFSDFFTGWDGVTVFPNLVSNTTVPSSTIMQSAGVARYGNDTTPSFIFAPDLGMTAIENYANTMLTIGGGANSTTPVGGVLRPAGSPNVNFQGRPLTDIQNVPSWRFDTARKGAGFVVPGSSRTISTTEPTVDQDYETYSAFLRHRIGTALHFELAFNHASEDRNTNYLNARRLDQLYIDVNGKLPNGSPNPYYLQPYAQGQRSRGSFGNEYDGARFAAAYILPENRFGHFLVNLMGGFNQQQWYQKIESYRVLTQTDPRNWAFDRTVDYRYYLNGQNFSMPEVKVANYNGTSYPVRWIVDSQRPTDISETDTSFTYLQGAINGKFFKDRLHTIFAFRHDDIGIARRINDNYGDYPVDWNGSTVQFRPSAPADYLTLEDARPRAASRQPLVSSGRYKDDYNPPDLTLKKTTYSVGAVFHVTDWISVFANAATGYNPSGSLLRLDGSIMDSPESKGWDAGIRFSLADKKININLSRYASNESAQPFEISFTNNFQSIAMANVVGDTSDEGINQRGMPIVPRQAFDRRDRKNEGYELEIVANITSHWRLSGNAAWADATQFNAFSDSKAFIAKWDSTMKQIILDSGGVFNAVTGRAEVNSAIPADQRRDSGEATGAFNNIYFSQMPNFVDGAQKIPALTEFVANIYTDYEISTGPLKRLRLGAGANYRGHKVINYRGADTIQNPNMPGNPSAIAAIDDPNVDAYTVVYDDPYWLATLTLSYPVKLKDNKSLRFQLQVSNLFDEDKVVYGTTTSQLPPGGDYLTSAARVSTPVRYRWQTPRTITFKTTLDF